MWKRKRVPGLLAQALVGMALVGSCFGCSVLSHEAIVDAVWATKLEPVIRSRFPNASPADLKNAHAYAYGGSIIQDLGYYPHGSKPFSDMTHYVKTGDFLIALVTEAHDLNELAFALGALSHYSSDSNVHRFATNTGEAILYPKLERKFGKSITYEQDPAAHLKTEFGFDVLEVAKGTFAPDAYHDFIGFAVAVPLLDRAFQKTYGLALADVFSDTERAIGSYRRAVSTTIPAATRIAWAEREHDIEHNQPGITRSRFVYLMSRSSFEHEWGSQYDRPSLRDKFAALILKLVPPVGPLRTLRFRMPTPEVEKLFLHSVDRALTEYGAQLDQARSQSLRLENTNYDIGGVAKPGTYELQDEAYAFWLDRLAKKQFTTVTQQVRQQLVTYFQTVPWFPSTKLHSTRKTSAELSAELNDLKHLAAPDLLVTSGPRQSSQVR